MVQTQETSSSSQLPSQNLNLALNYYDPYFLSHEDNPNSKLGQIIFNGSNYVNWSRSIQLALDAKNKLGFIDGSLSRPNAGSAEFQKWMHNDCMVTGWILNSIDKSTSESFIFTQHARQLWIEIKERYGRSDAPQLYECHKNLMNIEQHDDSIADYYGKLMKIWDQLAILEPFPTCTCGIMNKCTCGLIKKMLEADELKKLIQFIAGLNKNYDQAVKVNLLSMDPLPSVNKAYHMLHQIEKQNALFVSFKALEMRGARMSLNSGSNFRMNTGSRNEIKYDSFCEHCKMRGHLKDQCFKIIGYPDWFKLKNPQMSTQRFAGNVLESSSQGILGSSRLDFDNDFSGVATPHSTEQQVTSHLYKQFVKMMQSSGASTGSPSSGLPYSEINFADIDPSFTKNHATPEDWLKALSKVVPAVVVLRTTACRAFDTEAAGASYATGFVVDKRNGIILTNRHVVKPGPVVAEAMFVNGEEVPVYPIYRDPVHDFGFFRYDPDAIQFLSYEDIPLAPEAACVGLEIRVVGNDSGEKVSILAGTLARLDRDAPHYKKDGYNDFNTFYMQAASGTKGGSSGSPVIDWQGRAVALSAGSKSSSASAFYLPLQRVVRALEFLRSGRETFRDRWEVVPIPRGTLQMTLVHIEFVDTRRLGLRSETEQLVRRASPLVETGMLVVDSVVPGGPAHNHLEPGDILIRLNGEVITQFLKMETLLDDSVHQNVELQIERAGKPLTVVLPVEDLHSITPNYFLEVSGAIIHPLSYQQARNFRFHCGIVYVSEPGYMLYRAGVPRHAIIKKFAGEEIMHLEDLITVLSKLSRGARVPLEYISYTDRHRSKSVLVTVDGHQWYAPPLIYTRDDNSGLWIAKPAFPPEASPLSSVINQVESGIVTADTSLYGHDDLQLVEPSGSEDAVHIENQGVLAGAAAGAANASVVERVIEPALVMLEVYVPSSCMLDGVHGQHFFGTGVIIYHSETMGLVVVDRNTVAISASEVMLSFTAFPIEIPGEVVFLHPIHNYALVSYNPAALGTIGASLVRAAELLPEPAMRRGDSVYLVGLSRSLHTRSRKSVVTNACASLNIPSADCPRYRQMNMEVIELDNDKTFWSSFSGALTDERGRVQAIWGTFSTQKKYSSSLSEDHQFAKGIPIYTISSILKKMISGAKGPSLLINGIERPMPLVRILEVELYPTPLSKARGFGLSDNWIRALVKKDPVRLRVLRVKGCFAGSSADNLLEQGDIILAINKELVTCYRDIEDACQLLDQYGDNDGKLNLTILRQGSEIEVLVGTDVRDGTGTTRVINWCGCIVQEPHSAVRALGFLPKEGHGVYITSCCLGSPVQRYGLSPRQWIVEINGKPTPDLDSFVDVTKELEHGVFVRVKTIQLNGKPRVLILKQDLHYWPTWELRFDRETAQWHRKTIKALNCNTA